MRCVNPACYKDIADPARFCPFCRAEQAPSSDPRHALAMVVCARCSEENPEGVPVCARCGALLKAATPPEFAADTAAVFSRPAAQAPPDAPASSEVLVLRPGESVWHAEEPEGALVPGQRRPLLVLDEQVVHLSHTDRRLEPGVLRARVQALLDVQQVPVEVRQVATRWLRDGGEVRPRLVASLREHPYGDVKLLLGVDYMGTWASIQMHVGVEPEPLAPVAAGGPAWSPPLDAILAIVLGVITLMFFVGVFGIAYGVWRLVKSKQEHERKAEADGVRRREEQARRERKRAQERLSRTFKVDDMRLFCSAMRSVFQAVVDDVVERGGEVTRVEGGQGGFFQAEGLTQPSPGARRSDAALAEV